MHRILVLALMTIGAAIVCVSLTTEMATACEPEEDVWLTSAASTADCHYAGDDAVAMSQSGDGHVYTLRAKCDAFSDDINRCKHFTRCGPDTPPNYLYNLLRDGAVIGEVCLDPDQAGHFGEITPGLVLREFKSLEWPSADLAIETIVTQPPGIKTLVNSKTLFYTALAEPQTQTVTLLGHEVLIEAAPTRYIWHSDQGDAETWETTDPSRPIDDGEDPADMNHYVYMSTGDVRPSVDVVYTGRYRVNGGAWQEIPDTLTVAGEPVPIGILEATPVLTGEH